VGPAKVSFASLPVQHKVIGASAAVTIIAAFLPWVSVLGVTASGIRGDGLITLILGILGGLVILANRAGRSGFAVSQLMLGGLVLIVGIYHANDAFAAIGVYLTLLAGLVWVGALAWWWFGSSTRD
jgi:hypothetical protein